MVSHALKTRMHLAESSRATDFYKLLASSLGWLREKTMKTADPCIYIYKMTGIGHSANFKLA